MKDRLRVSPTTMDDASCEMTPPLPVPAEQRRAADGGSALERMVESIYDGCHQDLLRYLLLTGCDLSDANDFLQEAFLRLVRHLKQGRTIESPRFWLLRVLRNLRTNEHQRTARYVALDSGELEALLNRPAADSGLETTLLRRERYERVRVAMASLTERQYHCVLLRANGLKLREIADLFGISVVTVAEACGRAMEKLGRLKNE